MAKLKPITRDELRKVLRKNGTDDDTIEEMIANLPKGKTVRYSNNRLFINVVCGEEIGTAKCATYDRRTKIIVVQELCDVCKTRVKHVKCAMKDKFNKTIGLSIATNRLIHGE